MTPTPQTQAQRSWSNAAAQAGAWAKRIALAVSGLAIIALIATLGLIVAVIALAAAAVVAAAVGVVWLLHRLRTRMNGRAGEAPEAKVLHARRGPQGWTVDLHDRWGSRGVS